MLSPLHIRKIIIMLCNLMRFRKKCSFLVCLLVLSVKDSQGWCIQVFPGDHGGSGLLCAEGWPWRATSAEQEPLAFPAFWPETELDSEHWQHCFENLSIENGAVFFVVTLALLFFSFPFNFYCFLCLFANLQNSTNCRGSPRPWDEFLGAAVSQHTAVALAELMLRGVNAAGTCCPPGDQGVEIVGSPWTECV